MSDSANLASTSRPQEADLGPILPGPSDGWLPLALVGVVAAAPAAWWIAGGVADPPNDDPDYFMRPLSLSDGAQLTIGMISILLVIGTLVLDAWLVGSRRWSARWIGVIGPLMVLAGYAGFTYYVWTYPVVGANIDAGLVILYGVPWALLLIGVTTWSAWPRQPTQPPTPCGDPPVFGRW